MADRLELRGLRVRLGDRWALDGVDWSVSSGELAAVIGPNGAGKTTLLRALLGSVRSEGTILLNGSPLAALGRLERARRVAWVPQSSRLSLPLPVWRVVAQGRHMHAGAFGRLRAADHRSVEGALAEVDALHLLDRPYHELSGGEQRRVLIARALATEAPVLLLDEPTASLDIEHALLVLELARRLCREGRLAVVVLHELEHALRYASSCLLLDHGKVVASGRPDRVLTQRHVREVYHVRMIPGGAASFELEGGS